MSKFGRKHKHPPPGFEYVEPTLTVLENELREKVNEPHEGLRKTESQWPIHQINWQKSRYIYDLYYTFNRISKQVYDYCIENKIVDAGLIAKWKKPGYERLCSTYAINPKNYKFGTVSICRVPASQLPPGTEVEDPATGCKGCASGSRDNIFGNKYGQYLAAIQLARENRAAEKKDEDDKDDDDDENDDEDEDVVIGLPSKREVVSKRLWAETEESALALKESAVGALASEVEGEGQATARHAWPPGKRSRT